MYCIYCGKEIKKGYDFCPECGKPLVDPSVFDTLSAKVQKLEQEKNDVVTDKDRIISENNQVKNDLNNIINERNSIVAENQNLVRDLKKLKSDRDWLFREKEGLTKDLNDSKSDRDRISKECDDLRAELQNTKTERDRYADKNKDRENNYQEERAKLIEELKRKDLAVEAANNERDKAYKVAAEAENSSKMIKENTEAAVTGEPRSRKKMIIIIVIVLIIALVAGYLIGHAAGKSASSHGTSNSRTTEQSSSNSSSSSKSSGTQSSSDSQKSSNTDNSGVITINKNTKKGTVLYSGKNIVIKYNRAAYDDSYDPAEYVVYFDVENSSGKTINVNPGSDSYADDNAIEMGNLDDNDGEIKANRKAWVAIDIDKDGLKKSGSADFKTIKTSVSISNADYNEFANFKISLDRSLWNH